MNITVRILLISSIFLAGKQPPDDSCTSVLKKHFNRFNITELPKGDKVYSMKFTINSTMRTGAQGQVHNENLDVHIVLTSEQYIYQTRSVTLFVDEKNSFMIFHPAKQIVWSNGVNLKSSRILEQQLSVSRSILVNDSKTSCENVNINSNDFKIITVHLTEPQRKRTGIKETMYYINSREDRMEKILVLFNAESDKVSQEFLIKKIDFNFKEWKTQPVYDEVFVKNSQLKKLFRNYKLIDNRK